MVCCVYTLQATVLPFRDGISQMASLRLGFEWGGAGATKGLTQEHRWWRRQQQKYQICSTSVIHPNQKQRDQHHQMQICTWANLGFGGKEGRQVLGATASFSVWFDLHKDGVFSCFPVHIFSVCTFAKITFQHPLSMEGCWVSEYPSFQRMTCLMTQCCLETQHLYLERNPRNHRTPIEESNLH